MIARSVRLLDSLGAQQAAARLLEGAMEDVYWSAWTLDFETPLGDHASVSGAIPGPGVHVSLTLYAHPFRKLVVPKHILRRSNVDVRIVTSEELLLRRGLRAPLPGCSYLSNHQKYMVADARAILLNGVDVDSARLSHFSSKRVTRNPEGWVWAEQCVLVELEEPCEQLREFVRANHASGGVTEIPLQLRSHRIGLVSSVGEQELQLMRAAVQRARDSIWIESQYIWALPPFRAAIIDEVLRRLRSNLELRVTIVGCFDHLDVEQFALRRASDLLSRSSYGAILGGVRSRDRHRLKLYKYRDGIFQHRKLMIVDDSFMLVTSSNLSDRSLMSDGDNELGVYIRDPAVVREAKQEARALVERYGVDVKDTRPYLAAVRKALKLLFKVVDSRLI